MNNNEIMKSICKAIRGLGQSMSCKHPVQNAFLNILHSKFHDYTFLNPSAELPHEFLEIFRKILSRQQGMMLHH